MLDTDTLWDISCGDRLCNVTLQQIEEADVDKYGGLTCNVVVHQCAGGPASGHCTNCSERMSFYKEQCCGSWISQLQHSFDHYNVEHNNCSSIRPERDDSEWYFPVALALGLFVTVMLGLIAAKNWYKKRTKRSYLAHKKKQSECSVNSTHGDNGNHVANPLLCSAKKESDDHS